MSSELEALPGQLVTSLTQDTRNSAISSLVYLSLVSTTLVTSSRSLTTTCY